MRIRIFRDVPDMAIWDYANKQVDAALRKFDGRSIDAGTDMVNGVRDWGWDVSEGAIDAIRNELGPDYRIEAAQSHDN